MGYGVDSRNLDLQSLDPSRLTNKAIMNQESQMSLRISHLRLLDLIVQSRRPQPQGAAVRSSRRTAGTNRMERSLPSPAPRATPRPRSATGCGDVRVGVRTNAYPGICRTEMNQESRNALADQSPTLVPSSYHPEAGEGVKRSTALPN